MLFQDLEPQIRLGLALCAQDGCRSVNCLDARCRPPINLEDKTQFALTWRLRHLTPLIVLDQPIILARVAPAKKRMESVTANATLLGAVIG
jgi:hypothetical protein